MNVDEAIEIATSTAITMTKLEMAEVAEVLAAEVERLRGELAAAKAASVVPVEIVSVEDADLDHGYNIDVGIQCKSEADADILLDWLRDRTKERSEG